VFRSESVNTTEIAFFAECLTSQNKTLDKDYFTLGKAFAECNTRQKTLDKYFIGKEPFAEYFFRTLGKDFAECRKTLRKLRIEKIKKTAKHFLKL
jgi:hypothetical protein